MKLLRLLPPLLALAGASLGLSACNAGLSDAAAQVGSSSISRSELNATLSAMTGNAGFACVISGGNAKLTTGAGDSYPSGFAAQILTTMVEAKALRARAAAAQLTVTPFTRTIAKAQLLQAFAPGQSSDQSCTTPAQTIFTTLPARVRTQLLDLQSDQDLLAAHAIGVRLTPAGVANWARSHRAEATISCIELAPFPSASEAAAFAATVSGGSTFQAAASALGTQAQGGCVQATNLPSNVASAIAALSVGKVSAPVSYSGSYLVLELTSRSLAQGTEAAQLLLQSSASTVSGIVSSALAHVRVSVNPAYGTWRKVAATYEVVPPKGPPANLLLNPSAVGVAGTTATSGLSNG